jgi:ubiquinone/menaquinone biosynthesis C-methylase UbiE
MPFFITIEKKAQYLNYYDLFTLFIMKMDFYKTISKGYDELYGNEQKFKVDMIKENLKIKNNDLLLDVGCGTGLSSDFDCNVIGIEPLFELIQQNKSNTGKSKISGTNSVGKKIMAAAENIPFKDNVFDKVISITAIHNFKDIKKSIKEIKRVGKKDFVFSVLKKSSKFDFIEKEIKNNFEIKKILDGKKDWIFICQ